MKFHITYHYGTTILTQTIVKFATINEHVHGEMSNKTNIVVPLSDIISITPATRRR